MISQAEKAMQITRKKGSTVAVNQLSPSIQQRRKLFLEQPPPVGIRGVPLECLLDLDESGWSMQSSNRTYGKSYKGTRVCDVGQYSRTLHWNLLLAICGDGTTKHGRISSVSTEISVFYDFVKELLAVLPKDRQFVFMWDNLSSHNHPHIYNLIHSAGHVIVPRPPYSPDLAPIEFVFNTIEKNLENEHYYVNNENEFVCHLQRIVGALDNFERYFNHCGYQ